MFRGCKEDTICYNSDIKYYCGSKKGFTLAEVLITLGIIAIVAALTLPAFFSAYKKQVVAARLKSTYSIIANALKLAENDYGDITNWDLASPAGYSGDFIKKYIIPYTKSVNCSYPAKQYSVYTPSGNLAFHVVWTQNNNMYCLANGVAILGKAHGSNGRIAGQVLIVDINGPSGVNNQYGKDVFEMYVANEAMRSDGYYTSKCQRGLSFCVDDTLGVLPSNLTRSDIITNCMDKGGNCGINSCGFLIQENNWKIPDDYPVKI